MSSQIPIPSVYPLPEPNSPGYAEALNASNALMNEAIKEALNVLNTMPLDKPAKDSMLDIVRDIIELLVATQKLLAVNADVMNKFTAKIGAHVERIKQVPIKTGEDIVFDPDNKEKSAHDLQQRGMENAMYANLLEGAKAMKSMTEDAAKRTQTILESSRSFADSKLAPMIDSLLGTMSSLSRRMWG